jgi:hypothetical protein
MVGLEAPEEVPAQKLLGLVEPELPPKDLTEKMVTTTAQSAVEAVVLAKKAVLTEMVTVAMAYQAQSLALQL